LADVEFVVSGMVSGCEEGERWMRTKC
jgi:hypothetical protein